MLKRLITLVLPAALLLGCSTAPATNPVPLLDPQGDVYKTEGPNDPLIYDDALGSKSVIIVYCDFPDRPANEETTEQRAAKVLGGTPEEGTFQQIFKQNSYGKLTLDITQVPGWRTMPKGHQSYDPATTEGHREMFLDAFALYPEVDFNAYDYTMVLMTAKGNFAFGERDDEAIPHRGQKINVALNQGSRSPYVLAHELAHCMGLPDLYTYGWRVPEGTPKNPLGPWDIMSSTRTATGFIGWHRHKLEWLDDNRKTYLTQGTHIMTVTPLNADDGISMVVVPATGEDTANPSKAYVIEVAQYLQPRGDIPKPRGVLVYSVDATIPTGFNPLVLYPRADKLDAAYHEGDRFENDAAPFGLRVLKKGGDESYEIEVVIKP
ncbi:MAG: hypothetical protein AAGI37_14765 [Planctomycetota bacterium]